MGNQQGSLQYTIFMDNIILEEVSLHKHHTLTNEDKLKFIKSYISMSAPEQYAYLNLGRATVTLMRQKLLAYIKTLPNPKGFTPIPINSNEVYLINEYGIVIRQKDRIIIKPMLDTSGYLRVSLVHTRPNGSVMDYERVHRLMGLTFLDNSENKRTINHIDGNKLNNQLSNLEWATDSENIQHAHDIGLQPKQIGPRLNSRKFTEEQRIAIRSADSSISTASLAREYGLSEATIYNIRNDKHK